MKQIHMVGFHFYNILGYTNECMLTGIMAVVLRCGWRGGRWGGRGDGAGTGGVGGATGQGTVMLMGVHRSKLTQWQNFQH